MNLSRFFFAITTLAFFVALAVSPVHAGSLGNGAAQRMKLVVDSVDATGGTIVLKSMIDNSVHTYKIDGTSRITVGHTKGSIDQIKAGQKVVNYRVGGGVPPQTLEILMVAPAAAEPAAPANK